MGPIEGRCGARLKQTPGAFCVNYPVSGSNRCRLHGGKSLKGIAHPNWQGGRRPERLVNVLPERMKEAGERAANDELLGSLRGQMAILEARLSDLLSNLDTEVAGQIWTKLGEALDERERHTIKTPDWTSADMHMQQLIRLGVAEQATWEEIRETADLTRKLSDSEHRRLERLQSMIPADRALAAFDAILTAVHDVVEEQEKLDYIARRAAIIMTSHAR